MPWYNLLGIDIYIPDLGEIVDVVVSPITSMLTNIAASVIEQMRPIVEAVADTLSPLIAEISDAIAASVVTIGSAVSSVIDSLGASIANAEKSISSGIAILGSSVEGVINGIGSAIQTQITSTSNSLAAGIDTIGAAVQTQIELTANTISAGIDNLGTSLSGMIEAGGQAMITAFDGMGNAISGVLGGVFSGFGSVDVGAVGSDALINWGRSRSAFEAAAERHSPMTPGEAWAEVMDLAAGQRDIFYQLYLAAVTVEAVSLGQIDGPSSMLFQEPSVAAANKLAVEWYAARWEIGVTPLLERFILSAYQPNIPPYQDLISIYVKEGYLEDHWLEIPAEMIENFKELGYSEYWSKRLWGKHWQYPSPTQLYEMLHRTAGNFPEIGVTPEKLREMLKLHDFEPKWRSPLEAISWSTWRIYDIRTGWEMDLLDDAGLESRLVDTGFEPKDAALLANVQKMFVLRSEIDSLLTESDTDYKAGWISEETLRADYAATPYNASIVELRIQRAKLRQEREDKEDLKAALINRFKKGDIDEKDFSEALSNLGVQQNRISVEVEKVKATILKTVSEDTTVAYKKLTEATYNRAFKYGLISEDTYREAMAAYKYSDADVDLLVELNSPAKPTPEEIKTLTVSELKAAYRVEVITEEEFRAALQDRKYSDEDIETLIETEKAKIKPKE